MESFFRCTECKVIAVRSYKYQRQCSPLCHQKFLESHKRIRNVLCSECKKVKLRTIKYKHQCSPICRRRYIVRRRAEKRIYERQYRRKWRKAREEAKKLNE